MGKASTRFLAYAGLLTLGGVAIASALDSRPRVKKGSKIFLLGDSLAVSLSRPLSALALDHSMSLQTLAKNGTRIDSWSNDQTLLQQLRDFKPDLILVSLGTNDEYMQVDAREQQAAPLQKLLTELKTFAPILWIGPPTLPVAGPYALEKPSGAIELIQGTVPSYFPSNKLTIPRGPDGLHPTVAGAAGWAAEIWKSIA